MSRDWTPRELYTVEQQYMKNNIGSLWDLMKNTTVTVDGETTPLYTEESISHRQRYPLLGRLFDGFDELYAALSKADGGLDLLRKYENQLDLYVKCGEGDPGSPLIQWFEGKLDKNFYYRETNDSLFLASVQKDLAQNMEDKRLKHRNLSTIPKQGAQN